MDEEHERIVLDKCEQILEWVSANPVRKTNVMSEEAEWMRIMRG